MKTFGKILLCSIILTFAVSGVLAQNEANIWAFGDKAWIDFNTSPPTVGTSSINTSEGSSSVADAYGNPLFYTDGNQVWKSNHAQMSNGFGLKGNGSSTQSALIVPCNCGKYFIFTPGTAENQYVEGLNYSVVDMTSGGGVGSVINSPTKINNLVSGKVSEKLAGISDGNGGYWVVAHKMGNNEFVAFKITTGTTCTISPTPVFSFVGATYTGVINDFGQGQMKISPDGTKLALAGLDYNGTSFVELFNFNVSTGAVTDIGTTTLRDESDATKHLMFYGVEFSPNSKNLYVTTGYKGNNLYQYNATATTDTAFENSRDKINSQGGTPDGPAWAYGQLQLAPDGRIYIARPTQTYISAITNPNDTTAIATPTSIGYVEQGITLASGSKSKLGLPTVVTGNSTCFSPTPGGSFDPAFDTDGINTYPLPATQEIVGAALQQTTAFRDRIVVASRYDQTNTKFEVRIFDKDTGSFIKTQSHSIGSNAFANAMTVDSSNDNIYVGGAFGNDLDTCTIVRFSPDLLTTPQVVQISIAPAALKRCIITDLEVSGNKLYALASTTDASFKQAVSIIRINLPSFTPDSTWKNPPLSNINGFVRTPLNVSAMDGAGKLAIDASRIYAFATISGSANGTAVVGYDKNATSPVNPSLGYGMKTANWIAGRGVYFISGFSAADMLWKAPNLILNGDSSGNFGLAKIALPAMSAVSHTISPTVDLNQTDGAKMLALGSSYLISAGNSSTNTTGEIGIAKYFIGSLVLTNLWSPANLRSLALNGLPLDFTANSGDLRRIRTGNASQRLMFSSVLIQSTGKIVIVGIKMITNTQWELVLMRIAN